MTQPREIVALTQSRGIAALVVACHHVILVGCLHNGFDQRTDPALWQVHGAYETMARLLMAGLGSGRFAVYYFFILSGYVLGLTSLPVAASGWWVRGRDYRNFVIRRFFRLWPVHAAVLLGIVLLGWGFAALPHIWPGVPAAYSVFGWRQIVGNLLLWNYPLNGVTWSLWYEALAAVYLLPLLAVMQRLTARQLVLLGVALFGLNVIKAPVFNGFNFAFMFYGGAVIAYWQQQGKLALLLRQVRGRHAVAAYLLGSMVTLVIPWWGHNLWFQTVMLVQFLCGTILLLFCLKQGQLPGLKKDGWVTRFGRVSYSFYLIHGVVLAVMVSLMEGGRAGALWSPVVTVAVWLVLGGLMIVLAHGLAGWSFRWIEKPALRLGKRLTAAD